MAFVVPEEIEEYAEAHTTPPTGLLAALSEETHATLAAPQMLTGPIEGRFLELGTFSGYSSISMAAGLAAGGHIDTCEVDEKHASVARRYIEEAGLSDRITIHMGPGLDSIEALGGEWDLVFIDADKPNYLNYYEAVVPRLTERGIVVADNTLWSGKVLDSSDDSESTVAIREFNDRVRNDDRVVCVQLTIRDGVTLIRRA